MYSVGYKYEQENNSIISASFEDLLGLLDLPSPARYSALFEELPSARVFGERSISMLRSDCAGYVETKSAKETINHYYPK